MTRLIKLMMVATLVVASVAQAQIFDEAYGGAVTGTAAYVTSNGVEWVANTGLTISNSAAVFEYTGIADVTNIQVAFTVIPVLNDAIPANVAGSTVVFWVGTDSNVYYLVDGGTTVSNDFNVIQVDGSVDFFVKIDYVAHTFDLRVNGATFDVSQEIFGDAPFYDDTIDQLSSLEIRETSAEDVAIVKVFVVQELDANGEPTAVTHAIIKAYEQGGEVYVELIVDGDAGDTFELFNGENFLGVFNCNEAYKILDAFATAGGTYNYTIHNLIDGVPDGPVVTVDPITVLPVLEAKSFEMSVTDMTLVFASVPGETYQVVGLTALIDGVETVVADDIAAAAEGYTTSVTVTIGDNFYFKIIKK